MTTTDLTVFGGRDEIKEIGFRLRQMMPSAQSFTEPEALAVAQIAHAHGLDPFNGEVWGIKGYSNGEWKWYGVMVGIKGLRKCARRNAAAENSSYWLDFVLVEPKKYAVDKQGAVVYECHLRDAANMGAYGKAVHNLTNSGIPYKEAVEMAGNPPVVVGVGIADPSERSKMGIHQRAKKRAEADALKIRYDVDFGGATFTVEDEGEIVDASAENLPDAFSVGLDSEYPHKSELENMHDLGFDSDEPPIPQTKSDALKREQEVISKAMPRESVEPGITPQFLVNEKIVDNAAHAEALMQLLGIPNGAPADKGLERIKLYNSWRKIYAKKTAADRELAAKKAIAGEVPA